MSRQDRRLFLAGVSLIAALLALGATPCLAGAQGTPDALPPAPGDSRTPAFDATKPDYGSDMHPADAAKTMVAEVDGRAVTLGEVGDAIRALPARISTLPFTELFPSVLHRLVGRQALVIRAQHQGLDEDPTVRRKMQAASDEVLANEMLRQEARRSITEQSLLKRYDDSVAGKPGPYAVHLRVIMLPTEEAASGVIADLRSGADFASLARARSQDATASAGGDLGFVQRDGLTAEVGAVAFATEAGQFTAFPVASAGAWFVVKVEERRRQPTPSFSMVHEQLTQALLLEAAPDVVKQALNGVSVRQFDISGKETAPPPDD